MERKYTGRLLAVALLVLLVAAGAALAAMGQLLRVTQTLTEIASASAWPSAWPTLSSITVSSADPGVPDAAAEVVHVRPPPRRQVRPLSSAQLGEPLAHETFVAGCGAPDDMKVVVKVTVKSGRAIDAEAKSTPPNPVVESCVEKAVRDLRWDVSPSVQHLTVRY
jgi:hypothetical protein